MKHIPTYSHLNFYPTCLPLIKPLNGLDLLIIQHLVIQILPTQPLTLHDDYLDENPDDNLTTLDFIDISASDPRIYLFKTI